METTNYKLSLCDDAATNFIDWRKSINGANNSNMTKIDAALASKADTSIVVETTLSALSWTGDAAPYTQDIMIDGLTAEGNGTISVSQSASAEQRSAARYAMLAIVGQEDGKLTIAADGDLPVVDIPVAVILYG